MTTQRKKISAQLRDAILNSGKSRYQIAKETGLPQSALSRFVNEISGLTSESIDLLGECLNLRLVVDEPTDPKPNARKTR